MQAPECECCHFRKASSSKPMSEGVAVTMTLLVGAAVQHKTAVTLSIHNSNSDFFEMIMTRPADPEAVRSN
jgi:hypothetical protein